MRVARQLLTEKEPCSTGCLSDLYVYLPAFSFSFHVTFPLKRTPVALETPGPTRWKLSFAERS